MVGKETRLDPSETSEFGSFDSLLSQKIWRTPGVFPYHCCQLSPIEPYVYKQPIARSVYPIEPMWMLEGGDIHPWSEPPGIRLVGEFMLRIIDMTT